MDSVQPTGPGSAPKRILVVDDDYEFVDLLQEMLPLPRYELLPCLDPAEAFDLARATRPDLMMIDLWFPQMTGYDLIYDLLREENTRVVPILVCSGVVDDIARVHNLLRRHGAERIGVLAKPFTHEELLAQIEQLTSSSS